MDSFSKCGRNNGTRYCGEASGSQTEGNGGEVERSVSDLHQHNGRRCSDTVVVQAPVPYTLLQGMVLVQGIVSGIQARDAVQCSVPVGVEQTSRNRERRGKATERPGRF